MARKQRVEAQVPVSPEQAVEVCRRLLVERGAQLQMVTAECIKARVPGTVTRKYVAYELEIAPTDRGASVRIATWTSNVFSTKNDLVGRAARELRESLLYEGSKQA